MADHNLNQGQGVPRAMVSKYRDMGDGTHALVRAVEGNVDVGNVVDVVGPLTDEELRATAVSVSTVVDKAMEGDYIKGYWLSHDQFDQILIELKKIRAHLAILTGEQDITGEETE